MTDIFDDLVKQAHENDKRWKEIDDLYSSLKNILNDKDEPIAYDGKLGIMTRMLLLLVDQIRPVGSVGEQATKLQQEVKDLLKIL